MRVIPYDARFDKWHDQSGILGVPLMEVLLYSLSVLLFAAGLLLNQGLASEQDLTKKSNRVGYLKRPMMSVLRLNRRSAPMERPLMSFMRLNKKSPDDLQRPLMSLMRYKKKTPSHANLLGRPMMSGLRLNRRNKEGFLSRPMTSIMRLWNVGDGTLTLPKIQGWPTLTWICCIDLWDLRLIYRTDFEFRKVTLFWDEL